MIPGKRLAFGFDWRNALCFGWHFHARTFWLDFFGFYLNFYFGKVERDA